MKQKSEHEERRFQAAIQGVKMEEFKDPDDENKVTDFESLKKRADIKRNLILQGKNPDDYDSIEEAEMQEDFAELAKMGFGVEWE